MHIIYNMHMCILSILYNIQYAHVIYNVYKLYNMYYIMYICIYNICIYYVCSTEEYKIYNVYII